MTTVMLRVFAKLCKEGGGVNHGQRRDNSDGKLAATGIVGALGVRTAFINPSVHLETILDADTVHP